ncbi:DUF2804 domain-containing protein [Marinobacter halodurans]|uniref:DUF2804 domain-containing protein n=1 Tax=Marinobacter halodurans TaxID=2528979 RepID=A0ABY1ZIH6_9GAMM|nr:DUF2804 domain-containing protein [Marinobacter halodurans]TBW49979.1 DUF2804 domain-containing protein [Marinobacter halodurans]
MDLILPNGQPRLGTLDTPVDHVNYRDFDLRSVMDRPRSRLARYWRFNQFQFISAMGPDWLMGLAVVDLRLVSNAFFYLYDFRSGEMQECSWLSPLALGTDCDQDPEGGRCRFARGGTRIDIRGEGRQRRVDLVASGVALQLTLGDDEAPLRVCSRAGYDGWVFTRKSAGLPVSGEVRWGDRVYVFDERMRGTIDWSAGFMRRETAWNWACLAGKAGDGTVIGLNLAAGVNETGITENALWLDGELIKLDLARFGFDRYSPDSPWRVTTSDGRVDLTFEPAGVRREKLNVGLLASNFRQYAGTFSGHVVGHNGRTVAVSGLRGLMEDHFARW